MAVYSQGLLQYIHPVLPDSRLLRVPRCQTEMENQGLSFSVFQTTWLFRLRTFPRFHFSYSHMLPFRFQVHRNYKSGYHNVHRSPLPPSV